MFKIYMINFGYFLDETFPSIVEAVMFGREKGFEFSVHECDRGKIIGSCTGASLTWKGI